MNAYPTGWVANVVAALVVVVCLPDSLVAEPPKAPKVSSFAPAKELEGQADYLVVRLRDALANEEAYDGSKQSRVKKDANLLVVVLMGLGLHDEDNRYRSSAAGVVPRAGKLVEVAEDYGAARAAFDAVVQGMQEGVDESEPLRWEKRYKLGLLMKQVSMLNARLRRSTRKRRFAKDAEKAAGYAAVMAAIAQAALVDTHEVKDPANLDAWYQLSAEWRDSAAAVGEAARAQDFDAATAAMKRMKKNCDDCHTVFRPDQL